MRDDGSVMVVNASQLLNKSPLKEVNELGRTTDTNFLQFINPLTPIAVTEFGMVMDSKLLHPENADTPMVRTDAGIVMEANAVHPINVLSPMVATFEGLSKVTPTRFVLLLNVLVMAVTGTPLIILGISTVVAVPI